MFDEAQKSVALDFARALSARDYARARAMLGRNAQAEFTPERLREEFERMIPLDWGEVAPIEIVEDPGWASIFVYVSLGGPVYSEAVIVSGIVFEEGAPKVDQFQFGRP